MLNGEEYAAVRKSLYDAFEYNFIRIWADKILVDADKTAWRNFDRWASRRYGAIMSKEFTSVLVDQIVNNILSEGSKEQKENIFDLIIAVHGEMISNIDGVYIATNGEVFFPNEKSKMH